MSSLLFQLGLFVFITLRPFSIAPADRTYFLLTGQGAYTAFIREAKDIAGWNLYNPYTTRTIPSIYYHVLYVLLGKTAAVFSLDPLQLYMAFRVISGLILFGATYWLIITILPAGLQSLAVLFTLGLEPGPLYSSIKNIQSITTASPAIFSYFPQELALRHFGLPHHVLAEAAGLVLVGYIYLFVKKSTLFRFVIISLLTIAGAFLMPAYNSVLVLTVFVAWFVWALTHRQTKKILPALVISCLCLAAVGIFTKLQMDMGYPYKNFNLDEKRWVADPYLLKNFLSSLLLYIPASLLLWITLPRMWRRMTESMQLMTVLATTWVLGPLLYIPLTHFTFFPFANFRLVDGYAYVPAGILAAFGIWTIGRVFHKYIAAIIVVLMIAVSVFLTATFTRQTLAIQKQFWSNVYPLNREWDAIRFLSTVRPGSSIMVLKFFGEIIPSYATVRVFLGETPGFIDWNDRYNEAVSFYSGEMTDSDALNLLHRENISYVYWGQDEKGLLKTTVIYPTILSPVFSNPAVTVFQVKK